MSICSGVANLSVEKPAHSGCILCCAVGQRVQLVSLGSLAIKTNHMLLCVRPIRLNCATKPMFGALPFS